MKKVLFATTALVASAGFAAAEIELTGGAAVGFKYTGSGDVYLHNELDFNIVASGTTDNGLTFGASLDIDDEADDVDSGSVSVDDEAFDDVEDIDDLLAALDTLDIADEDEDVGDAEAFISGAFGTLTVGEVAFAADALGLPDAGFDGIGLDDDIEALRDAGSANVSYKYSVDGFSLIASTHVADSSDGGSADGDFSIVLGYAVDGFSGMVGYSRDDSADAEATAVQLGYTMDAISLGLLYADHSVDGSGFGLSVAYTMDALTVSLIGNSVDNDSDDDIGVGFKYDLGGGMAVAGGFGNVDGDSVWDLGVTMSF